jgi:sugar phosphate isomerase/epimerase
LTAQPIIAVCTLAWHGYDFATAFREIAQIGAKYVEPTLIASYFPQLDDGFFSPAEARKMRALLEEQGLQTVAIGAHMNLGSTEAVRAFSSRLEFAARLGARIVHTNSSLRGEQEQFLRNLESLIPQAEKLDLTIGLENPGDGEGSLFPDGVAGAELVRRIGSSRVRLNYDFSNVFSYSRGNTRPEQDFLQALPYAAHLHFKETCRAGPEWAFVEIGGGLIDYSSILRALAAGDRIPPLSLELPLRFVRDSEYRIRLRPDTPPVPLELIRDAVKRSLQYIRKHLEKEP